MQHLGRVARSIWVRALVSVGLLGLVLSQIDFGDLRIALEGGRWELFVAALAVLVLAFVVGAVRWRALLTAGGLPTPLAVAVRAYFAGVFASSFLPGGMAGDVARVLLVAGPGSRARCTATVLFDRFTIFAAAVALGWIAVLPAAAPRSLVAALGLSTCLVAGAAALMALAARGAVRLRDHVPTSLRGIGREALSALRRSLTRRVILGPTVGLGTLYELLTVLSVWLLARSVQVDVSFWILAVVAPPVMLLSAVPISIGGLGVREATYVALLGQVEISATDATLVSLLAGITLLLASLPGALVLVHASNAGRLRSSTQIGPSARDR